MKHFLLAAFLIVLVKGDRSNPVTTFTPHTQYPRTQNARFLASDPERVLNLNTKRSPIAFPQPEFNFPHIGDQFLQSLQQSESDGKSNYGVPAPQIRQSNNYNQQEESYKHPQQELDEDSDEEDSPEKLNSYGVKSAYESPQQSQSQQQQPLNPNVQNVKYLSGFVPSFGPPTKSPQDSLQNSHAHYEHVKEDGSKIFKHVSVHVAPESESGSNRSPRIIKAQGPREKHYNIIFVKAPEGLVQDTEVHLQPPPQQKTVVYVLAKDQQQKANIKLATPAPTQVSAPEVYFVRYQDEKNGKTSQYGKGESNPTYAPPMQNAYFPLSSPTPTTFAALTFPTLNSVYQTEEALPYNVPVLTPSTSYSTPPNSYVTLNPTFAPTVFSTLAPANPTTNTYGTPLTLYQSLTLEEIGTPNPSRQQHTNTQFSHNLLQNIQENAQNYNHQQQYRQENQENQPKQQYQSQFQQENQVQQLRHENSQNNNNFQPSRQEFHSSPLISVQQIEQPQQQYHKPTTAQEQQQREYQLVQPPSQSQQVGDYQIVQANPPQHFHISLPNHHIVQTESPAPEQSGEYSSTTITATKAKNEEDEHFPLVFEATRTTSRLNHENNNNNNNNNSEGEKNRLHPRKRKVKRGRKRMRKVKKSRRNKNKDQALRNHNQH